jgi:uracil-DNA glycosylase
MQAVDPRIDPGWKQVLQAEFAQPYFLALKQFLLMEREAFTVYPPGNRIFAAFDHTPFSKVKVVILGQDPYHGPNQAHGLCFSVPAGVPKPPSLRNIFRELREDIGIPEPASGNLEPWASQGVLLINATLTVRAGLAGSHQNKGWERFTDKVIYKLSEQREHLVFMLWGNYARAKDALIDPHRHLVLYAPHPSPLSASRGFFGCRHFSRANGFLEETGQGGIDWRL